MGKELSTEKEDDIRLFLDNVVILGITDDIKKKTIELRKNIKLKLPYAIIVATAEIHNLTLVTADKEILRKYSDHKVINPLDIQ